ncbi:MAG: OsmC family protein [Candidatus Eisenbacteria bacterium]|uniref:OsmC family protein n=1 Tax=Eiseniibacteriota bacterium TaxID=2212470 RepID=A0A956RN42_UNCEI|nr:OsmC family protein [Candidatus Eisenbacteria bacterium]
MKTKTAVVKYFDALTFVGKTETNHWLVMDSAPDAGGSDASIRPKEMLLLSLAGCTSMDVVSILKKKRVPFRSYEIRVTAEMSEEHPKVYTKIHLEYVLTGEGIKENDVEHAIALSQDKYCGVSAMLRPAIEITHSYRIEP